MTIDKILDDKRLFDCWYDMSWLRSFFQKNLADLSSFFHITDVYEAVMDTIDEAKRLECVRNYLLAKGVYDLDGFNDYIDNEQGN